MLKNRLLAATAAFALAHAQVAMGQTLPAPNLSNFKRNGTAFFDGNGYEAPIFLPQFSGPCGTASSGTATFNCNGLLSAANTWGGLQTFNAGLTVQNGNISLPNGSFTSAGTGQFAAFVVGNGTSGASKQLALNYDTTNNIGTITSIWQGTAYTPLALNPNGTVTAPTPAPADVSANVSTTSFVATAVANLKTYVLALLQQNYTLQVPSAAALRTTAVFTGVMAHRGGFATPGDGGAADYAGYGSACPASTGDDGGSCLNAPGGSWRIDLASQISPELFPPATDQATQWQAAATALCARSIPGGRVVLAAVNYQFTGKSSVSPNCPVAFDGKGFGETVAGGGTTVHIASSGSTANGGVTPLQGGSYGVTYERFLVYQDQPTPDATAGATNFTPIPYPPVFNAGVYDVKIRHIGAAPVYDFATVQAARSDICALQVHALHSGIIYDNAYDVTHSSCGAIEFFPFWSGADSVINYQQANATAITIGGIDGAYFPDLFLYAYQYGVKFVDSPLAVAQGTTHYATSVGFGKLYCDACKYGIASLDYTGQAIYQYPTDITVEAYRSSSLIAGSSSLYVPGALSIGILNMSAENILGSTFTLSNVNVGSQVRIGWLQQRNLNAPIISAPTVTGSAGTQHDISISHRPTMPTNYDIFGSTPSAAIVTYPKMSNVFIAATSNSTYQFPLFYDNITLFGGNSLAGVTIQLPANPVDGQIATLRTTNTISNFAVTAVTNNTTVSGYTTGTFSSFSEIVFVYRGGFGNNFWQYLGVS